MLFFPIFLDLLQALPKAAACPRKLTAIPGKANSLRLFPYLKLQTGNGCDETGPVFPGSAYYRLLRASQTNINFAFVVGGKTPVISLSEAKK